MTILLTERADVNLLIQDLPVKVDEDGRTYLDFDCMHIRVGGGLGAREVVSNIWPDGRVPYFFDDKVTATNRNRFREAARLWMLRTAVKFVELQSEPEKGVDYIHVNNSSEGNWADIGYTRGKQNLKIKHWHMQIVIVHELGHSLGLIHEHCRSDRENYVSVIEKNVLKDFKDQFFIFKSVPTLGPYDFSSIMHYDRFAFGETEDGKKKQTIVVKDAYAKYAFLCGQRAFMSHLDSLAVESVYGSNAFEGYVQIDTREWPDDQSEKKIDDLEDAVGGALFIDLGVHGPDIISEVRFRTESDSAGDCDLYVRRVPLKEGDDFWNHTEYFASPKKSTWASKGKTNHEDLVIPNGPQNAYAVRYLIMLHARAAYDSLTFTVSLKRR